MLSSEPSHRRRHPSITAAKLGSPRRTEPRCRQAGDPNQSLPPFLAYKPAKDPPLTAMKPSRLALATPRGPCLPFLVCLSVTRMPGKVSFGLSTVLHAYA
jgi:hypothetical protein